MSNSGGDLSRWGGDDFQEPMVGRSGRHLTLGPRRFRGTSGDSTVSINYGSLLGGLAHTTMEHIVLGSIMRAAIYAKAQLYGLSLRLVAWGPGVCLGFLESPAAPWEGCDLKVLSEGCSHTCGSIEC